MIVVAPRDEVDPRIERSRMCVLVATADLLREVGYGQLTIEAVAARSGVAKSTIYRHYGSKAELVSDAFTRVHSSGGTDTPPPGPVRGRVAAILTDLACAVDEPQRLACLMPALIDAAERSDEMAELAHRMADESAQPLRAVLDQAVESGELPPHTDTGVLADALVAPIVMARLFHRPPVAVADIPALVDQILPAVSPLPAGPAGRTAGEPQPVDR
jgi:AcrR family transcriptional regulator